MKYGVSSYSFFQYINAGKMTTFDCIAKAKDMGFDAVEFTDFMLPEGEDIFAYAQKLAEEARRVGIEISNYAVGADFLTGSDGDIEKEIEKLYRKVDVAKTLGCSTLRHDVTGGQTGHVYEGYENTLERLSYACRKVAEYAKTQGIRTMTENHGFFSQDSLRVEKLINTVASDNFGWLVDIGNFLCADDDPQVAVGRAAKYAFHVHAKDFIVKDGQQPNPGKGFFQTRGGNFLRGTIIGHGDVPVVSCLRALKRAGYEGGISIEFEGMEDCLEGIAIGLENLKKYEKLYN